MKKQYIIPIFVPHLGCPNDCTFCNQKKISGQTKQLTKEDIKTTIEYYLSNFKDADTYKEIAFFGGSFTGIEESLQEEFLQTAYEYVKDKKVDGIRISTRPDYINKDILKRLKKYSVKTIELGVQSTNDYILSTSKRGHTYDQVKKASRLIRWHGFNLGHQMMVGLPESTRLDELNTAKDLAKLRPKMMRIYPVLVIKDTELERQYEDGIYTPLTLNQAVEICKELVFFFNKKQISVIRIGLQNSDTISNPELEESSVVAGPYHESFRQLVEASMFYDVIVEKIKKFNVKVKEVMIITNKEDVNNVVGHKRENLEKLKEIYNVDAKVDQDEKIKPGQIDVKILSTY